MTDECNIVNLSKNTTNTLSIIVCVLNIQKLAFFHLFHSCFSHTFHLSQITLIFMAIIVRQSWLPSLTRYSSFAFLKCVNKDIIIL